MRIRAVAVAAALVMSLGGCAVFKDDTPIGGAPPLPASPSSVAPSVQPRIKPTTISIPVIGADSSLIPLGNINGAIEIPDVKKPEQAGWYCPIVDGDCGAPYPGEAGPAVILGHVDGGGKRGVFFDLKNLKKGDEIQIGRDDHSTAVFVVSDVEQHDKDDFPFNRVFGETPEPALRLVTCGGVFDKTARSYEDNIIVFAERAA